MRLTQRHIALGLQILLGVGTLLVFAYHISAASPTRDLIMTSVGIVLTGAVAFLYWKGWRYALYLLFINGTILPVVIPPAATLTRETILSLLLAPTIALILGRPVWVLISALLAPVLLFIRAGDVDIGLNMPIAILYGMLIGGMALARLVTEISQRRAEENARYAEAERTRAEQHAHALAGHNQQMNIQLDQQRRLLDLVAALDAPAVPLAEGMLLVPIIGHVDKRRAESLTARLLQETHNHRSRMVILDITGVALLDTIAARALLDTAYALRLLGCKVAFSGVTAPVATTLMHLGIDLDTFITVRSPQEALAQYLGLDQLMPVASRRPRNNGRQGGRGV